MTDGGSQVSFHSWNEFTDKREDQNDTGGNGVGKVVGIHMNSYFA